MSNYCCNKDKGSRSSPYLTRHALKNYNDVLKYYEAIKQLINHSAVESQYITFCECTVTISLLNYLEA